MSKATEQFFKKVNDEHKEKKEKAMSKPYRDITYCSDKECMNKDCERNHQWLELAIKKFGNRISVCDFAKDEKGEIKCVKRVTKQSHK